MEPPSPFCPRRQVREDLAKQAIPETPSRRCVYWSSYLFWPPASFILCPAPPMFERNACRRAAYALFRDQLPALETTEGLLNCAIAISLHELGDVDISETYADLDVLADEVRWRLHSDNRDATVAHLHEVLFEENGFGGNTDAYYSASNSYIPLVLETRRGIPISLTLIYKVVAEKLGLFVEGLNSPGHFLARVDGAGEPMIVDPYFGGKLLSRDEAFARIEQMTGTTVPRDVSYLLPATHHQWIARMLNNLQCVFAAEGRQQDLAAMTELQGLLANSLF